MSQRIHPTLIGEFPRSFADLQRHVDQVFSNVVRPGAANAAAESAYQPAMNVVETETAFEITVELPGVKAEDVSVELEQGYLRISGRKAEDVREEGSAWRRVERRYGAFQRVVKLGAAVDPARVTAESRDGVLYVAAAKAELAKSRKIQVSVARDPSAVACEPSAVVCDLPPVDAEHSLPVDPTGPNAS